VGHAPVQQLYGDPPLERLVEGAVDGRHPSGADLLLQPEAAAEQGAYQGLSIVARSMSVRVRYFTDPACPWSWSAEPTVRKLMVEFGEGLSWTFVMGGLARDYTSGDPYPSLVNQWMDVADEGRMPIDPRL